MKTCLHCGRKITQYTKKYCKDNACIKERNRIRHQKFKQKYFDLHGEKYNARLKITPDVKLQKLPEYFRRYMRSEEHYNIVLDMLYDGIRMDVLLEIFGEDIKQWLAPVPKHLQKTA